MDHHGEGEGIDWSPDRLFPTFQPPERLSVYDMRGAAFDLKLSVATLVGCINRPVPRVYLIERGNDVFWLEQCFTTIPQDHSPLKHEAILKELVRTYRQLITGLIIYDPDIPDSVNVATMLAGQRDALVVSPTLAQEFRQAPDDLPVLTDLRTLHWKSRLDVYQWAFQHLLKDCSPRLVAGLDPAIPIAIRPFLVATRAFIYWLDPLNFWPQPTRGWESERCLMRRILRHFAPGTAHLGWFMQEGAGVNLTSHAALPVFASDLFSNLEVWISLPSKNPLPEQAATSTAIPELASKVYVSFTLSEGDNLQYLQERLPQLWLDATRGSLPIGWATSPALIQAAPAMAEYYARTATANDELLAGPSGAGYMYPSNWPAEHLPLFLQRTGHLMREMRLSVLTVLDLNVGQDLLLMLRALFKGSGLALIDRNVQKRFLAGLAPFGLRGVLSGAGQERASWKTVEGELLYQNVGIASSESEAVAMVRQAAGEQRPYFINLYVLAWKMTPTLLQRVVQELGSDYEIVTPATLLTLLTQVEQGVAKSEHV